MVTIFRTNIRRTDIRHMFLSHGTTVSVRMRTVRTGSTVICAKFFIMNLARVGEESFFGNDMGFEILNYHYPLGHSCRDFFTGFSSFGLSTSFSHATCIFLGSNHLHLPTNAQCREGHTKKMGEGKHHLSSLSSHSIIKIQLELDRSTGGVH